MRKSGGIKRDKKTTFVYIESAQYREKRKPGSRIMKKSTEQRAGKNVSVAASPLSPVMKILSQTLSAADRREKGNKYCSDVSISSAYFVNA